MLEQFDIVDISIAAVGVAMLPLLPDLLSNLMVAFLVCRSRLSVKCPQCVVLLMCCPIFMCVREREGKREKTRENERERVREM
jgi:hypothetical protein